MTISLFCEDDQNFFTKLLANGAVKTYVLFGGTFGDNKIFFTLLHSTMNMIVIKYL